VQEVIALFSMSKYLLLKLGALGDLSFFLPVIDQIRKHDPEAQITWIVGTSYADFLRQHPGVNQVIAVDEKELFHRNWLRRVKAILQLWWSLDFFYSYVVIGHRTQGAFFLLRLRVLGQFFQVVRQSSRMYSPLRTEVVIPPLKVQESLAFHRCLEILLGKHIPLEEWRWDSSWISTHSQSLPARFGVIHLGGGSNSQNEFLLKKWPYWKELLRRLAKEESLQWILVGAPSERKESEEIFEGMDKHQGIFMNEVGKTPILGLISLLKNASLFVGVDSGPLHFADSLGVPCIGLYGPTSPVSWGLLGEQSISLWKDPPCAPCYRDNGVFPECHHKHVCMQELQVEEVMRQVQIRLRNPLRQS